MSRIAGGLGGTRHYPISMKGLAPHKRGRRPKPVHSSSDTLSVPAQGGYEWLGAPGLISRAGHLQRSRGSRAKAMGQTVREKALIRQAREDGRPSEDDVAQDRLDRQQGCGCATGRERPTRKKNPAEGGAQVLGRTNSEGRRARSTSTMPNLARGSARP